MESKMSKYIQEMAEKNAIEKWKPFRPFNTAEGENSISDYSAGAQDMKEHIGGFAEFIRKEGYFVNGGNLWEDDSLDNNDMFNDDQLVEKYFEQLNPRP